MTLEADIICILLNRPDSKFLTQLNPDWFSNPQLGWCYEAITQLSPKEVNAYSVASLAKHNHPEFGMNYDQLWSLGEQFVTDGNLAHEISVLRERHLNRQLGNAMAAYQIAPTAEGREKLSELLGLIDNAKEIDDGQLDDTIAELTDELDNQRQVAIQSIPSLDRLLGGGLYGGLLMTIGARPAVGKTAFAMNLAYEVMHQDHEVEVDYFSLEMGKKEIIKRFISKETGISGTNLRDTYDLPDRSKLFIRESLKNIKNSKLRIYDQLANLNDITSMIKRNAAKSKPNKYFAVVDYIGLINVPGNDPQYLKIAQITRELKLLTNEYSIPVLELSQLNRAVESRQVKRPGLSDLRDSGSIEQDSNVVGFLYHPDEDVKEIEILSIQKNREGLPGDIYLQFNATQMRFTEISKEAVDES